MLDTHIGSITSKYVCVHTSTLNLTLTLTLTGEEGSWRGGVDPLPRHVHPEDGREDLLRHGRPRRRGEPPLQALPASGFRVPVEYDHCGCTHAHPCEPRRSGRSPRSTGKTSSPCLQGSSAGSDSSSGSGGSSFQSQYKTWLQRYVTGNDISARCVLRNIICHLPQPLNLPSAVLKAVPAWLSAAVHPCLLCCRTVASVLQRAGS